MSIHYLAPRKARWGYKWVIAAVSLSLIAAGGVALANIVQPNQTALEINKVETAAWEPDGGGPLFIAVLGSDARSGSPGAVGGCDAVHIIAMNPARQAGTILNFPRDSFISNTKLTDYCRIRGFESAVQLLSSHTGLNIQYYIQTEFSHFRRLIDELGGIDIDVPYAMKDRSSGASFRAGRQHMNGTQALAFSRNRKGTPRGDFSRTTNQGSVILASLSKFRDEVTRDRLKIFDYLRVAARHTKLNLSTPDLLRLGLVASRMDPSKIRNVTVPGRAGASGSRSVVFLSPGNLYRDVRDDAIA